MDSAKKIKYKCENCKQVFDRSERLTNHVEKGCNRTTCMTCRKRFDCNRDLQRHQKNADSKVCDSCDTVFCHESELNRHKRTIHVGGEIRTDDVFEKMLDQPISPRTGFEEDEGYKAEIDDHWSEIRDAREEWSNSTDINKELSPDFMYNDLEDILTDICKKLGHTIKVNISFGFMLCHVVTNKYRYFYASTNTMLFNRAITLSKMSDVKDLMKRILDLDLVESYYMKRPSSGWVLAGLPNIFIKVMYMQKTLFG